MFELIRGIRSV